MDYTRLDDIDAVDLTRHALIEASAGTGKTYTIENLVVRLIRERSDISLENILVVTFTEKATSELKVRIREKLEQESDGAGPEAAGRLRDALDAFDTASITTIHGFCHTVLREFAFENGALFESEVVDDAPIYDSLIREQMRKTWPECYGEQLPELLQLGGFGAKREDFLSLVVRIARHMYRPEAGDALLPDTQGEGADAVRREAAARAEELRGLLRGPPRFSEGFSRLHIHAGSRKSLLEKIVRPLEDLLVRAQGDAFSLPALAELAARIGTVRSGNRNGIESLLAPAWLKKGPNPEVCPQRKSVVDTFLRLEDALMRLSHLLAVDAVRRLREDAAVRKQKVGVIGYDDMLERVHAALCGERAPQLLETLRQRYRIAFVDEFQDTDPIQWRIFRRLFLEDSETGSDSRLMLIGDPKQAIYSFRGADVYAYLEARNEMERLAAEGRARLYSLATNFRSQTELVSLFNRLFGRNEWFSAERRSGPFDIEYRASASPGEDDLSLVSAQDRSGRASLNLVDLRGPSSPRSAKPVLARFVAAEILRLTRDRVLEIQPKGGERRSLHFGDICILVRSRSEAFLVEMELADRGIPYSFYKKPGLFQSEEALYLSMVFRAVADPGSLPDLKKAMLTPFFGLSPADLMEVENLSTDHPVRRLVHGWYELAAHRRWGRLFQSLIEDSGLLFRTAASRYRDRILTNYRQIFEHLTDEAYRKNLDFRGLSSRLDADRNQSAGTRDDVDIHQIETDEPRVQIMTLHVSKGLQFPVVFVAGGLTRPPEDPVHVYHVVDGSRPQAGVRRVIDLSRRSNRERHLRERDEEDKRLYYVALTRAQCKLYVPFFPLASEHAWVGPASRFLPVALAAAFTGSSPPAGVEWCSPDFSGDSGSKREADGPAAEDAAENGGIPDPLLPPEDDFRSRSIRLDSFSSLHGTLSPGFAAGADRAGFRADRDRGKEEDEGLLPRKPQPAWDLHPEEQMPGGTEVGSMFHDILERIDYAAVLERPGDLLDMPETAERIAQAMEAYRIDPRWRTQVCRVVADALTAPIRGVGKTFRLGALSERDRIHEVEFTYSRTVSPGSSRSEPECATSSGPCGFVRGFVDLVFRHDGRFFIADWKSNRIDDGYRPTVVAAHMNEAGYVLQYKLYTVAVLRWLRQTLGKRFDPDTHFGGVFYFFIRGMGAGDGSGIHYVPPEEIGPGDRLEAEIAAVLAGAGRS